MRLPARVGAIEIGRNEVRIAVVRTGLRQTHVLDLAHAPIPARDPGDLPAGVSEAVRSAIDQLRVHPATFVLAVPASWSVLRLLRVPFRGQRKIAAAVPFELEPNLAIPIEDLIVDFLPARTVDGETEVLAVGLRRAPLEEQLAIVEAAGVAVEGVYLDALALTSLWYSQAGAREGARAVLHLRPDEAFLAVVENKRVTFLRRIDADASSLRADPAGVARDVRNLLRAYAADWEGAADIASVTVTGADLLEAGRMVFETELETAVRYRELALELPGFAAHVPDADMDPDTRNRWSTSIAAAANAAGGPFHLNFFHALAGGETSRRGLAKAAVATCLAASIVIAALLALAYVDYRRDQAQLAALGEAVWNEFQATYPDAAVERPPNDAGGATSFALMQEAAQDESGAEFGVSLDLFNTPPLLDILLEISDRLPENVAAIRDISVRPVRSGQEITLSGEIRNSAMYNEAVQQLNQSPLIRIDSDRSRRRAQGGEETFVLVARF